MAIVRILCIGDVVGAPGRAMFEKHLASLRATYAIDAVIVNGENSSEQGRGITPAIMEFFIKCGVQVVTSGNHIWAKQEIQSYLQEHKNLLRPANYPPDTPGVGVTIFTVKDQSIAVINLQGRVFMREHVDCPFRAVRSILTYLKDKTKTIIVDMHAEASSEKIGIGYYLDGKVSAVVGTHTHVQTADERILPGGTAFITDLGMVGALDSMLGMKKEPIISHFITQLPTRFVVETNPPFVLCGVWIEVDTQTGQAKRIERIRVVDAILNVPS